MVPLVLSKNFIEVKASKRKIADKNILEIKSKMSFILNQIHAIRQRRIDHSRTYPLHLD